MKPVLSLLLSASCLLAWAAPEDSEAIAGERKGLVVLVQFADVTFAPGHDVAFFDRLCNQRHYTDGDFVGSVRDYFLDQSDGLLDYTFDIVGPLTLSRECAFYGQNTPSSSHSHMGEFLSEALSAVVASVDLARYDSDADGLADQVFFIYAGYGEADTGRAETIWPHTNFVRDTYGLDFCQGGVSVNTYACANELQADGRSSGIGIICHEFSHCLGLPDMYDTLSATNYGTGVWDLMDSGAYLGDQFLPCGFTAYERAFCGWRNYEVLTADCHVPQATALSDGGRAYAIYNDAAPQEYFLLEPRRQTGWDAALPASGLLVYHVDYSPNAWLSNRVNADAAHQRCAILPADSDYSAATIATDAFPAEGNTEFSDKSTPSATLFNAAADGSHRLARSVYDICRDDEGLVSFSFMLGSYRYDNGAPEGALFYESFDRCRGTGGNDAVFGSGAGTAPFVADHDGWNAVEGHGADRSARFGTDRVNGVATTPPFFVDGAATLTFRAAPYLVEANDFSVSVLSADQAQTTPFALSIGRWTDCTTTFTAHGAVRLRFEGRKRWFLDEVLVMPSPDSALSPPTVARASSSGPLYNLAGQRVTPTYRGLVIAGGRATLVAK